MRHYSRGFTLIELLVVVAIIGILSAVGVVSYSGYKASAEKKQAEITLNSIYLAEQEYKSNMLDYMYLIVVCVLSIELFLLLRFMSCFKSIIKSTNKVFRVIISSNVCDHWKEKVVPVYAFNILKNSLLILGVLFLIINLVYAFVLLSSTLLTLILSIKGIVISIIISFTYLKLRIIII